MSSTTSTVRPATRSTHWSRSAVSMALPRHGGLRRGCRTVRRGVLLTLSNQSAIDGPRSPRAARRERAVSEQDRAYRHGRRRGRALSSSPQQVGTRRQDRRPQMAKEKRRELAARQWAPTSRLARRSRRRKSLPRCNRADAGKTRISPGGSTPGSASSSPRRRIRCAAQAAEDPFGTQAGTRPPARAVSPAASRGGYRAHRARLREDSASPRPIEARQGPAEGQALAPLYVQSACRA